MLKKNYSAETEEVPAVEVTPEINKHSIRGGMVSKHSRHGINTRKDKESVKRDRKGARFLF